MTKTQPIIPGQIDRIIALSAQIHRVEVNEILGPSRRQPVFHARMAAIHVLHERYLLNRFGISEKFGRTDNWSRWAIETGLPGLYTDRKFKSRLAELLTVTKSS